MRITDKDMYYDYIEVKPTHVENVRQIEEDLRKEQEDAKCKRDV